MKFSFLIVILLTIFAGASATAQEINSPVCPVRQEWKLNPAFSDEFNGAGLPDPADLPAVFEVDYCRVWQSSDF
jgi:hypothetical protein